MLFARISAGSSPYAYIHHSFSQLLSRKNKRLLFKLLGVEIKAMKPVHNEELEVADNCDGPDQEHQSDSGRCCGDKERGTRLRWFGRWFGVIVPVEGRWRCRRATGRPKSTIKNGFSLKISWAITIYFSSFFFLINIVGFLVYVMMSCFITSFVFLYQCTTNKCFFSLMKKCFTTQRISSMHLFNIC